jgi:DNA-binding GntR family transcriptional regulator
VNQHRHSKIDFTEFFKKVSVYDQIQGDIVSGAIRNGYAIEMHELCVLFQIDRQTADDIILDLIADRFIKKVGKSEALLVSYHSSEAKAFGTARLKLEGKALRPALEHLSAAVTQTCRKLLAEFVETSSLSERAYKDHKLISTIYFGPKVRCETTKLEINLSDAGRYLQFFWSDPHNLENYRRDLSIFLDLYDQAKLDDACRVMRTHISKINDAIVAGLSLREGPHQALCA